DDLTSSHQFCRVTNGSWQGKPQKRQRRFVPKPGVGARNERLPWVTSDAWMNPNGVLARRRPVSTPAGLMIKSFPDYPGLRLPAQRWVSGRNAFGVRSPAQ